MRLNSFLKDQIVNAAMTATFDPKFEALKANEALVGMRLYEDQFPASERRTVEKLSKKWVARDKCLRFNVGGMHMEFEVVKEVVVPANHGYCRNLASINDPDLIELARKTKDAREELRKDRDKARRTLRAMLDSIPSIKRLRETWPEGKAFYDALEPESKLPAPIVADINAMLGINAAPAN